MQKHMWRKANIGLIPSLILLIAGATICSVFGNVQTGSFNQKLIALAGVIVFFIFASIFLHILTKTIYKILISHHLSTARAAAIRFLVRVLGYIIILLD